MIEKDDTRTLPLIPKQSLETRGKGFPHKKAPTDWRELLDSSNCFESNFVSGPQAGQPGGRSGGGRSVRTLLHARRPG
jgi:hypothetical protein